jgi:hypothetical protein
MATISPVDLKYLDEHLKTASEVKRQKWAPLKGCQEAWSTLIPLSWPDNIWVAIGTALFTQFALVSLKKEFLMILKLKYTPYWRKSKYTNMHNAWCKL